MTCLLSIIELAKFGEVVLFVYLRQYCHFIKVAVFGLEIVSLPRRRVLDELFVREDARLGNHALLVWLSFAIGVAY